MMLKPAECVTGIVPSEPRVTPHTVPVTAVTAMISLVATVSATLKPVDGMADSDAEGNGVLDATVHCSDVPDAGAPVPPVVTVVSGWFANCVRTYAI